MAFSLGIKAIRGSLINRAIIKIGFMHTINTRCFLRMSIRPPRRAAFEQPLQDEQLRAPHLANTRLGDEGIGVAGNECSVSGYAETPKKIAERIGSEIADDAETALIRNFRSECIKHKQDDNMDWMEGKEHFRHVNRNTARLIKTVTGFDISLDEEGDVVDMMNAWENGLNQARNDAFLAGKDEGRDSTIVTTIRNLMETSGWNARQTMDAMKIPANEQEKYAKQI